MECSERGSMSAGAEWAGVIGQSVIGKAVGQAVDLVETDRGLVVPQNQDTFGMNGGDERCGVLYWWPVEVEDGRLVCQLKVEEFENSAVNSGSAFEINGDSGREILGRVADQLFELGLGGAGIDAEIPNVFFGTWHTHPRGSREVSAQDLVGEDAFDAWREAMGNFPLGNPRSFVLAMDDGGDVVAVVAYDKRGRIAEWTRQN